MTFSPAELRRALTAPWHAEIRSGPAAGLALALRPGRTIGRTDLADPAVSVVHATVERMPGGALALADAHSANGTFVKRIAPWRRLRRRHRIRTGMVVRMGRTGLLLVPRVRTLDLSRPQRARTYAWTRFLLLPALLFLPLSLGRFLDLPPQPLLFIVAAGVATVLIISYRRRAEGPSPTRLLLTALTGVKTAKREAELGVWLGSGRLNRRALYIAPRERVCFVGEGALGLARRVAAFLAASGQACICSGNNRLGSPDATALTLCAPHCEAPAEGAITWARSLAHAPQWATRIVTVPRGLPQVGNAWWEAITGALLLEEQTDKGLPECVYVDEADTKLAGVPLTAQSLASQWRRQDATAASPSLLAWLGRSEESDCLLDLVVDGPHALLAGTTGSGKSEALTTWILSLASRYRPELLGFVLIDYKGGEAFGALAALPHVTGVVTDLEPHATRRVITSLTAELRRRERAQRDGTPDPRRLLVVVDEFRRLAEEEPDLLDTLVRIATIGRSLGVHVMLATQRPGGIVDAHMRANLPLRVCLRVLDDADSRDVVGNAAASRLPHIPGRALLGTTQNVQIAWCGDTANVNRIVASIAEAAALIGIPDLPRPWAPPLPDYISWDERCAPNGRDEEDGTPGAIGWVDEPDNQRIGVLTLTDAPSLLVAGPAGSGRTGIARTIARAWRRPAHVLCADPRPWRDAVTACGTHCPGDVADFFSAAEQTRDSLIIIDDVDAIEAALATAWPPGALGEKITRLARLGQAQGCGLIVVCSPAVSSGRWAHALRTRAITGACGPLDAAHLGVDPRQASIPDRPGRCLWIDGTRRATVHIALSTQLESFPHSSPLVTSLVPSSASTGPVVSPHANAFDATVHRRWVLAGREGPERDRVSEILTALLRSSWGDVTLVEGSADEPSAEGALVRLTTPQALISAYTGPLALCRARDGLIILGDADTAGALCPRHQREGAQLPVPRPAGMGLVVDGDELRRIAFPI